MRIIVHGVEPEPFSILDLPLGDFATVAHSNGAICQPGDIVYRLPPSITGRMSIPTPNHIMILVIKAHGDGDLARTVVLNDKNDKDLIESFDVMPLPSGTRIEVVL